MASKMLEKTEKVAKSFLTIYAVMGILFSGAALAVNEYHEKFLKVADFKAIMLQNKIDNDAADIKKEIKELNNEIADLIIEKDYAIKSRDKKRIQALITRKKTQIKNLKGE